MATGAAMPLPQLRRRVAGLAVTHLVDDFYQGSVPALLPFFAAQRNYTGLAAGGLMFAATFLSSLLQPVFGAATDRYRMRWLIGVGMLIAGVGIGLCGLVDSYAYTWLVIAGTGAGVAAFHPEAARATREAAGSSAQAMSWFSVGGNIGIALAPVVVTPLLVATGLIGTPLLALPAVLLAALLGLKAARRVKRGRGVASPAAAAPAGTPRRSHTAPEADDWRHFGWLLAVVIARSIAYVGTATFLVVYLQHHFRVSAIAAGPALTVFTGTGAAGTVVGGWLADRYGRTRTLRVGYVVAAVGLAGLVLSPTLAVAYIAAACTGLGLYLPFAVHTTLGQDYLPNRLATASGLTTGLAISAGGLLAPALGLLADAHGEQATLAVLIVAPILAVLATRCLRDTSSHAVFRREPAS